MKQLLMTLIKAYRVVISPLYGSVCKYHPSCSAYGLRSVEVHGALRGSWLTVRRVGRCHPWAAGGYDPVPGTPEAAAWAVEQAESARQTPRTALSVGLTGHTEPGDAAGVTDSTSRGAY